VVILSQIDWVSVRFREHTSIEDQKALHIEVEGFLNKKKSRKLQNQEALKVQITEKIQFIYKNTDKFAKDSHLRYIQLNF